VGVQPRTLELFDDLGIVREALDAGMLIESVNLSRPNGRTGTLQLAHPSGVDSPYLGMLVLPQETTERILHDRLTRDHAHVVERGVTLTAIEQHGDHVAATLTHANGMVEEVHTRWVFGADGAHSAVRHLTGLPFDGITYHDEGLIGDAVIDWKLPADGVSLCPKANGFMLVFPLPGDRHFRVIIIHPRPGVSEERHLDVDEFRAAIVEMTPSGRGAAGGPPRIEEARWLTRYRLHRRGVPSFQIGRVFVGGDAAHIHSPVGAQGMNTGIQDAYNLAWKLALVARGEAPPWVLDTYDEERRHIGEILLKGTDRFFGVVAGHGWLSRVLRRIAPMFAIRLLEVPRLRGRLARFVSQLGVRYRNSRLSVEGPNAGDIGSGAPRAGDRAPDAPLEARDASRIFDLLRGPMHVVLIFPGNAVNAARVADDVRRAVERELEPVVRVEVVGGAAAHAAYGAAGGACFLIRPDGYVGFRDGLRDSGPLLEDLRRRFTAGCAGAPTSSRG
jgi:2-polyprenyl-6-methoxyphenol hydroxylase-like FAD-dependent oxidoreductase